MVLFVITYIQQQFLLSRLKIDALIILPILWIVFIYFNTKNHWIKPTEGGLKAQKLEVRKLMSEKKSLEYNEGDTKTYLYTIWTENKK